MGENPDPDRIGFPIAEVDADGTAVITKSADAGGMITFDTVRASSCCTRCTIRRAT